MSVSERKFGTLPTGEEVKIYHLENKKGAYVEVLQYGAILVKVCVPDKNGELKDVVLGYDDMESYEVNGCLLSKMMISGANILILDEPTNHLDMESITALNNGLIKFPGVILFTSHDHQFVQTTANRIMEILPNGKLVDKITTYDEYLASDEMAKKRHVFQVNEEDAQDN